MLRPLALGVVFLLIALRPGAAHAYDEGYEGSQSAAPSLLTYGFKGFWLGGELGLSLGYLTTGRHFDRGEWRNLVFGAGVGALVGVSAGVAAAMVDTGTPPPPIGAYLLRDGGYGMLLGALSGGAVGALFVIDSGHPTDILMGASIGSLIGAAVGVGFGIIEASAVTRREPPPPQRRLRRPDFWFMIRSVPSLTAPGRGSTMVSGVSGVF